MIIAWVMHTLSDTGYGCCAILDDQLQMDLIYSETAIAAQHVHTYIRTYVYYSSA